MNIVFGLVVA